MPFENKITTPNGIIGIWNLNDSVDKLLAKCQLTDTEIQKFDNLITERRKKEFLASRILLQLLQSNNHKISYNEAGKPFLKNSSKNISISHSVDFAAIYISDKNIGIDIEQATRKIDKVAKRFLHPKELSFIKKLENQQLAKILFWSAKEAIFKCAPSQGILFSKQIRINPFNLQEKGDFKGSLQIDKNQIYFDLHYHVFKNNVMVYCVEKENKQP